jgi:hypothetical protein
MRCIRLLMALLISAGMAEAQLSHVRIRITDTLGNPVLADRITLTRNGLTKEARQVKQEAPVEALYGRYTVEVEARGFNPAQESFVIDQKEQVLSLSLKVGDVHCFIHGRVTPEGIAARMRLVQIHGSYSVDVAVQPDGSYSLSNLDCGDYLLIALAPGECLGTRMLRVAPTTEPVDLRLTPGTGCTSAKQ